MTGLRFLFRVTLRRLDLAAEIYHLGEPHERSLVTAGQRYSARRLIHLFSRANCEGTNPPNSGPGGRGGAVEATPYGLI